jgi:hypothetical protein
MSLNDFSQLRRLHAGILDLEIFEFGEKHVFPGWSLW